MKAVGMVYSGREECFIIALHYLDLEVHGDNIKTNFRSILLFLKFSLNNVPFYFLHLWWTTLTSSSPHLLFLLPDWNFFEGMNESLFLGHKA